MHESRFPSDLPDSAWPNGVEAPGAADAIPEHPISEPSAPVPDQIPRFYTSEVYAPDETTYRAPEVVSDEPTTSFDQFTAEHTSEILAAMDGEDGFFGRAQREGTPDVDPQVAEIIDDLDDETLERLNITKGDLKAIAQTFGAGQERAGITHIVVPNEVSVEGDRVHTDFGDFELSRGLDQDAPVLPRGNFTKSTGGLWIMTPTLEERYPDPDQRRVAALWTVGHELTHGIIGSRVFEGVLAPPTAQTENIEMSSQGYMGQTTWLQQHVPETPLTEYSGSYRLPDGSMPSVTEGPIGYVKALEEEMCETTAATMCGFAPTPGRSTDTNLHQPFHDRGTFHSEVWRFVRASQ